MRQRESDMRMEALRLATGTHRDLMHQQIVEAARVYLDFLMGEKPKREPAD